MPCLTDRLALAEQRLKIAVEALTAMAAFKDAGSNERLAATGSYSSFDEPRAAEKSRVALKAIDEARVA